MTTSETSDQSKKTLRIAPLLVLSILLASSVAHSQARPGSEPGDSGQATHVKPDTAGKDRTELSRRFELSFDPRTTPQRAPEIVNGSFSGGVTCTDCGTGCNPTGDTRTIEVDLTYIHPCEDLLSLLLTNLAFGGSAQNVTTSMSVPGSFPVHAGDAASVTLDVELSSCSRFFVFFNLEGDPDPFCTPECFLSEGLSTITLDTEDEDCSSVDDSFLVNLTSFAETDVVLLLPGPYFVGQVFKPVMSDLQLDDASFMDPVVVRTRPESDKLSLGTVVVTSVDGGGDLTGADSSFELFLEFDVMGETLNTLDTPLMMESTITALPPLGDIYFPLPMQPSIKLYSVATRAHVGWLCHAQHLVTFECL